MELYSLSTSTTMKRLLSISLLLFVLVQCTKTRHRTNVVSYEMAKTTEANAKAEQVSIKPGSSFQDILIITESCALFYKPDSIQKEKIKAVTEPQILESSMHDFFYLGRYAHKFLKEHWSGLKIIEAKNVRVLFFIKKDRSSDIVDLDKLNDSYGLILFNRIKSPLQIDMANVETEVPDYFNTASSNLKNQIKK
jgi:hypothetical protein